MNIDRIREYLAYDPATGIFVWRKSPNNRVPVGARAGTVWRSGYRRIYFGGRGKSYAAHHLAWFFVHGVLPVEQIDHQNGDRGDNRIANLRPASASQNARNRRSARGSSSQYLGVSRRSDRPKWIAQIKVSGRVKNLGYYDDEDAAARAYDAAATAAHGPFANLNFPQRTVA